MDWNLFSELAGNKSKIRGKVCIGVKLAREIVARQDLNAWDQLADRTREYLPAVMDELRLQDQQRALCPQLHYRRCLAFALATPQRKLDISIDAALTIADNVETLSGYGGTLAMLRAIPCRDGRTRDIGRAPQMAGQLHAAAWAFESPDAESFTVGTLQAMKGIGPKVARMAMATANQHARVFTVDLWHARQLLAAAGMDYLVVPSINDAAYPILEEFLMSWADRMFPAVPMFAVQWALWDAAAGTHRRHAELWSAS